MPRGGSRPNAGKKKGSKHRNLEPIREKISQLIGSYSIEQMVKDLQSIEPIERLRIITGLLEFETPKLQRTDLTGKVETEVKQIFDFGGQEITF